MSVNRTPWERRLEDLGHHLVSCSNTYFIPDAFHRNVNTFLQTARTVTFLIQKNKSAIPDFDSWYSQHVLESWKDDEIMQWAKEARNVVEKEGDLEMHSSLQVTLLFSYLEENDAHIRCGRDELLNAGVKRLIRIARQQLPTGVSREASLKIERVWITVGLPTTELLQAFGYIYSTLFQCVRSLATHLQRTMPKSIPAPSSTIPLREASRQVEYVKLKNMQTYRIKTFVHDVQLDAVPDVVAENVLKIQEELGFPSDFPSCMEYYARMAEFTFTQWGNHIPMIFLLNSDWAPIDMVSPVVEDQADKYFFWRSLADRILLQNIHAVVHTAEVWIRDAHKHPNTAISQLPIVGEKLQVSGFDREQNQFICSWDIVRESDGTATLGARKIAANKDSQPFFFVPSMRSMGIEPDFIARELGQVR